MGSGGGGNPFIRDAEQVVKERQNIDALMQNIDVYWDPEAQGEDLQAQQEYLETATQQLQDAGLLPTLSLVYADEVLMQTEMGVDGRITLEELEEALESGQIDGIQMDPFERACIEMLIERYGFIKNGSTADGAEDGSYAETGVANANGITIADLNASLYRGERGDDVVTLINDDGLVGRITGPNHSVDFVYNDAGQVVDFIVESNGRSFVMSNEATFVGFDDSSDFAVFVAGADHPRFPEGTRIALDTNTGRIIAERPDGVLCMCEADGRLASVIEPGREPRTYQYNEQGDLIQVVDGDGTSYQLTNPGTNEWTATTTGYDGEPIVQTFTGYGGIDGSLYLYRGEDRENVLSFLSDGTVEGDLPGVVRRHTDGDGRTVYELPGRQHELMIVEETEDGPVITIETPLGTQTIAAGDGSINWGDPLNSSLEIRYGNGEVFSWDSQTDHFLIVTNGVHTYFDAAGRVQSIEAGGTPPSSRAFTYAPDGNLTGIRDFDGTTYTLQGGQWLMLGPGETEPVVVEIVSPEGDSFQFDVGSFLGDGTASDLISFQVPGDDQLLTFRADGSSAETNLDATVRSVERNEDNGITAIVLENGTRQEFIRDESGAIVGIQIIPREGSPTTISTLGAGVEIQEDEAGQPTGNVSISYGESVGDPTMVIHGRDGTLEYNSEDGTQTRSIGDVDEVRAETFAVPDTELTYDMATSTFGQDVEWLVISDGMGFQVGNSGVESISVDRVTGDFYVHFEDGSTFSFDAQTSTGVRNNAATGISVTTDKAGAILEIADGNGTTYRPHPTDAGQWQAFNEDFGEEPIALTSTLSEYGITFTTMDEQNAVSIDRWGQRAGEEVVPIFTRDEQGRPTRVEFPDGYNTVHVYSYGEGGLEAVQISSDIGTVYYSLADTATIGTGDAERSVNRIESFEVDYNTGDVTVNYTDEYAGVVGSARVGYHSSAFDSATQTQTEQRVDGATVVRSIDGNVLQIRHEGLEGGELTYDYDDQGNLISCRYADGQGYFFNPSDGLWHSPALESPGLPAGTTLDVDMDGVLTISGPEIEMQIGPPDQWTAGNRVVSALSAANDWSVTQVRRDIVNPETGQIRSKDELIALQAQYPPDTTGGQALSELIAQYDLIVESGMSAADFYGGYSGTEENHGGTVHILASGETSWSVATMSLQSQGNANPSRSEIESEITRLTAINQQAVPGWSWASLAVGQPILLSTGGFGADLSVYDTASGDQGDQAGDGADRLPDPSEAISLDAAIEDLSQPVYEMMQLRRQIMVRPANTLISLEELTALQQSGTLSAAAQAIVDSLVVNYAELQTFVSAENGPGDMNQVFGFYMQDEDESTPPTSALVWTNGDTWASFALRSLGPGEWDEADVQRRIDEIIALNSARYSGDMRGIANGDPLLIPVSADLT